MTVGNNPTLHSLVLGFVYFFKSTQEETRNEGGGERGTDEKAFQTFGMWEVCICEVCVCVCVLDKKVDVDLPVQRFLYQLKYRLEGDMTVSKASVCKEKKRSNDEERIACFFCAP